MSATQTTVFVLIVAGRLLIPLGIPRFPVPALLASLVLDAADQTIFQAVGSVPADYQSYDKALDVYYLAIAYAATLRNWSDPTAFSVGRFLWYYRLVGVVAFELTGARWLLLVFPNVFEYFFLAYEIVRVRWRPTRLDGRSVLLLAAGIWVVVKLPQEYWIHVAQLDVTEQIGRHPWVVPVALVALAAAAATAWALRHRLPPADWPVTLDVDAHRPEGWVAPPRAAAVLELSYLATVAEKAVLLGLTTVIFGQVLPIRSTTTQLVLGVAFFAAVNGAVSLLFARRGTSWDSAVRQFLAMLAINVGIVGVLELLRDRVEAATPAAVTLFVLLLLSLLITLYDRYRGMRRQRAAGALAAAAPRPALSP